MAEKNDNQNEPKEARYVSKYFKLKVVMAPAFTREVNGRVVTQPGRTIQFEQGGYVTSDQDEIDFLDKSDMLGRTYIKVDTKNLQTEREEWVKDLETREAELAAREKELADREARVSQGVATAPKDQAAIEARREELMNKTREELRAELEARDLKVTFNDKKEATERILESEFGGDGDDNAAAEGDGAAY